LAYPLQKYEGHCKIGIRNHLPPYIKAHFGNISR